MSSVPEALTSLGKIPAFGRWRDDNFWEDFQTLPKRVVWLVRDLGSTGINLVEGGSVERDILSSLASAVPSSRNDKIVIPISLEASTVPDVFTLEVDSRSINKIFDLAQSSNQGEDEHIFRSSLWEFLLKYSDVAIDAIQRKLFDKSVDIYASWEMLCHLGDFANETTHTSRRRLLERCLTHVSPVVREGAATGLSNMDDPHALPTLIAALKKEKNQLVHKSIELVIRQLQQSG